MDDHGRALSDYSIDPGLTRHFVPFFQKAKGDNHPTNPGSSMVKESGKKVASIRKANLIWDSDCLLLP